MLPFRKILFPVDYSAPCQAVIPYVQEMARHFSAELTVCHAYAPLAAVVHSELLVTDPELQAKAQALEEDRLRQFAGQSFPCVTLAGQKLESMVELGDPGSVIDRLAVEQRADLVMLATRGHGPVRRFLMGSITAKVLHDVSSAVWTGVGAELVDHPVRLPYQSIVYVVPTPPAYPDLDLEEHTKQLTEASQFRLRELTARLGIDAPHTVIDALLGDGIHQEVIRRKADLLVTGRGNSMGTFSRLWSHLYSIIRDSPCPVLSI